MDPFRIEGPAKISFSGGRTSGYMLWRILQEHDGVLPEDVHVVFANTGKEREETLRFVQDCSEHWSVPITWVEWSTMAPLYRVVTFETASRAGEPFGQLIRQKQRLPNWRERWCTQYLKVLPMTRFGYDVGLEPGKHLEVVGLRHDEGHRILKGMENAEKHGRLMAYPLARAKIVRKDVMDFWAAQSFDLGLQSYEGNCDACFLKGRGIRKRIFRERPEIAEWWAAQESTFKGAQERGWFDKRDSVRGLLEESRRMRSFLDEPDDQTEEYDTECGLHCGGDDL